MRSDKGTKRSMRGKARVFTLKLYEGEHDTLIQELAERSAKMTDMGRKLGASRAIISMLTGDPIPQHTDGLSEQIAELRAMLESALENGVKVSGKKAAAPKQDLNMGYLRNLRNAFNSDQS